jgi:RNA polymerase sigma-70 factor (ECF subfamily)
MPEREPDARIVAASRSDPARFEELFDRHFPAIHRYLARRAGSQLADDLAAETFVQAFRIRARYDLSRPDARPWLLGIATNLLRHQLRDERRRLLAQARTGWDQATAPDEAERVAERVDSRKAGPRIALALASLPRRDRHALLLVAWAGLSYRETAESLGIPVGTVRSRVNRARRHVRELVGDPGQYLGEDDGILPTKGGTADG